jgi:DNA-binding transcriptional LysR family regulator
LVPPARQARRDVETAAAAVAAVTGLVAGRLDLASLPTLAADPLADLVGAFRRQHPAVQVRLLAPNDLAEVAQAVRSGEAEVAITEQGTGDADLVEHPYVVQELLAVSPPGSPDGPKPLALRSLAGTPLALSPPGASLRTVVDAGAAAAGFTPLVAVETEQRDALVPLVLAGAGTTFLPAALARSAAGLGAVVRRTQPALRRTIALVHRPGALSPAARALLTLAGIDPH